MIPKIRSLLSLHSTRTFATNAEILEKSGYTGEQNGNPARLELPIGRTRAREARKCRPHCTVPSLAKLEVHTQEVSKNGTQPEKTSAELTCGEYKFQFVSTIVLEAINLHPQQRYLNASNLNRHQYGTGTFCKFSVPRVQKAGVYVISVNNSPQYVGETSNFARRFNQGYGNISPKNCFYGGQQTNCRINQKIQHAICDGNSVAVWFYPCTDYKQVELRLRRSMQWAWNQI